MSLLSQFVRDLVECKALLGRFRILEISLCGISSWNVSLGGIESVGACEVRSERWVDVLISSESGA